MKIKIKEKNYLGEGDCVQPLTQGLSESKRQASRYFNSAS